MFNHRLGTASIAAVSLLAISLRSDAESSPTCLLLDPSAPGIEQALEPTSAQVVSAVNADGLTLTIAAGPEAWPGLVVKPVGVEVWDLSAFGHVTAKVTNLGDKRAIVVLQPECDGNWSESPWCSQNFSLNPGETKTAKGVLGYNYGKPSPKFSPQAVKRLRIFCGKSTDPRVFRIAELQAAGAAGEKPTVDPATRAVKPAGGVIFGGGAAFDPVKQLVATGGAACTPDGTGALDLAFTGAGQSVFLKPTAGMWNLNEHLQVRIRIRNAGDAPVTPGVQLLSRGGPTDLVTPAAPIAPGEDAEIVVPFLAATPWRGMNLTEMLDPEGPKRTFDEGQPGTGTPYASNTTTGILIVTDPASTSSRLRITGAVADMPPRQPLPEWLGQRPPVEGDWSLTFEDNFDGQAIDLTTWNIYTEGEWHHGAATGYSKDNVIVKDGRLALRVEKRSVHHNDNPDYPVHGYATGWADSYGKWTQRYGYFEARLRLPTTPDSFTAFWLMPDRGIDMPPQTLHGYPLKRNEPKAGGMEFDIMEALSAWGPNRHDFGCHWDGYGKYHKSVGVFTCYFAPDAEGFLTVGMLWTPGEVVLYQNGREGARWTTPRVGSVPAYLILQHITGGWETEGMDDSQLPADLVFDYVRVWQRKDLASPSDGRKPNDGGPLPPTRKELNCCRSRLRDRKRPESGALNDMGATLPLLRAHPGN